MNRFFKKPYMAIILGIIVCGFVFDMTGNKTVAGQVTLVEETSEEQLHTFLSAVQIPTVEYYAAQNNHNNIIPGLFDSEEETTEEVTEDVIEEATEVETEVETEAETEPEVKQVIAMTDEDYQTFLRIVEAEATGGDVKSKLLVANVIINRVKHYKFPNTVTEVVFQNNQFSPIKDGRFYMVNVTETTIEAVNRALAGEDYSQGATFFCATYVATKDSWHCKNLTRVLEYGGHVYFKL